MKLFAIIFNNKHSYFLQRPKQMHIMALLSGLSLGQEETIVRASAVRALAIFVLFPSLKESKFWI